MKLLKEYIRVALFIGIGSLFLGMFFNYWLAIPAVLLSPILAVYGDRVSKWLDA